MKLYYHPVSTTSRMIMLFAAEEGVDLDMQVVDLMSGEHLQDAYAAINPNRLVPVLEDGDLVLTESAAILRYLGDKTGSPAYPAELKARARVHERMDWLNSNLYRDLGYGLIYPQVFPHHRRSDDAVQAATLAWAAEKSRSWLEILDRHLIGADAAYLCGERITLADYFGAPMLTLGEVIRCDYSPYPNLTRWIATMKALPGWPGVNEVFDGFVASVKDTPFTAL